MTSIKISSKQVYWTALSNRNLMVVDFQQNLKTVKFKGLHNCNDYAELFADRRTVVFSLPRPANVNSWDQLKRFNDAYTELHSVGIDQICTVSNTPFIIPYVEIHGPKIIPIVDVDSQFTELVKYYAGSSRDLKELATLWQYVIVLNNGVPEKLFNNPLVDNMSLKMYCNPKYQYFRLGPDRVIKYLLDNSK
jgi:peroxiredoxin